MRLHPTNERALQYLSQRDKTNFNTVNKVLLDNKLKKVRVFYYNGWELMLSCQSTRPSHSVAKGGVWLHETTYKCTYLLNCTSFHD